MSIEEMYRRANAGEEKALKFWDLTATRIGYGLAGVVTLLNPHSIVIGGGVSNNFKFLKPTIKRVIEEQAMSPHGRMVKIVRAKLGDDAGLIGARVLFTHG
jgi:glucokinase